MSSVGPELGLPSPNGSQNISSARAPKPQRVLACVLCQQRKIKCDRNFPCANCTKSRSQCVPATLTQRRRRRRFPERELLERLRRYEDLLRQNNIPFQPLHSNPAEEKDHQNVEHGSDSEDEREEVAGPMLPSPSSTDTKSGKGQEAKNIWHAMSQGFRDPDNDSDSSGDDLRETTIKAAWDQSTVNYDQLLFGSGRKGVDLTGLHPNPVQIFRLWQIYLDNVNPLLRVTHTPTLQGRIIEAASNLQSIDPVLQALMFSIYCMALTSINDEGCVPIFGFSRDETLTRYQICCKQALLECEFHRSNDRNCLVALYLYLLSLGPDTVAQSLAAMLSVAIRIAQRLGMHSEAASAKCTPFEAEMRRRLWWSLMLYDTRIGEKGNSRPLTLDPTWDCKIPSNVNDSDLRPEMKEPPIVQANPTDAFFPVVRSELADYVRHTTFHLEFTNPALKPLARQIRNGPTPDGSELAKLEEIIEDQYLKTCDLENPIHFMTTWAARKNIAMCRLLEHHARLSGAAVRRTEAQLDATTSGAMKILEVDAKIMTSPLTRGFLWFNRLYFPFPAFMQILQDLKRRPRAALTRRAWEIMSDSFESWPHGASENDSPFLKIFLKLVLQAWDAFEAASTQSGETPMPTPLVTFCRNLAAQRTQSFGTPDTQELDLIMGMENDDFQMPVSSGFLDQAVPYGVGLQNDYTSMAPQMYSTNLGPDPLVARMHQLNWSAFNGQRGW